MKKLLVTAIGAAAAFGAIAGTISTQRFTELDGSLATNQLNAAATPSGTYWFADADATNNTYTVGAAEGVSCPLPFDPSSPTKALDIKTTFGKPLNVNIVSGGTATNINSGLYFDSLVKFTVCEDAPADTYDGAKIIMWLQEAQDASGNPIGTNLVVRAGYLSYNAGALPPVAVTPTNYVCSFGTSGVTGDFADKWHRVTIKAIADITTGAGVPGFAIYIDKNGSALAKDVNSSQAKWDSSFADALTLNEGAEWLNDGNCLFPSMVQNGANKGSLAMASFDGTGSMTDLIFTDEAPAFAADYAAPKARIQIGDNVEEFTTLNAAIAALNAKTATAEEPKTITFALMKGMELDSALAAINNIDDNVEIIIDLNGCGITNSVGATLTIESPVTIIDSSVAKTGEIVTTGKEDTDYAILVAESGDLTLTAGTIVGYMFKDGDDAKITVSGGTINQDSGYDLADGKKVKASSRGEGFYDIVDDLPKVAENPWYVSTKAVVLKDNLPGQTGGIVSAFHGQGEGEYLGLTYSTNPLHFDLFTVDGTDVPTTVTSVDAGDLTTPGLRGVAISKTLGIAMTLRYATTTTMYAYPLAGGDPTAVTLDTAVAFDAAAFSPDGKYLFSNAVAGESSNQFYVKWSVAVDAETGALSLTKVGSIAASGRARSLAYARISGRDLVFGLVDTGKVAVIDMTGDDTSAWTAADLITDLPAHSYGTLCVSGVNVVDAEDKRVTPHLTVATSMNIDDKKGTTNAYDVLNVYGLTVPATGAVSASLVKSFNHEAMTAAGFGVITDANRYGNTVYVTDDEATIYFARPDNKLYAAQFAYNVDFVVDGVTTSVSVFPGDTVAQADPTKENYIFDGWFLPGAGQAFDLSTPVTQDLTLTAQFTAAVATDGTTLYKTFKDAVETATAGATVTILKDCTEPGMVTITSGITISNDYTVALTGMYALRFANGSTPVTICGTGTLAGSGEGSPLLIGSNETTKNAKYEITTTYEGSVILDGNTITYSGSGNVIKVEYGTFTMNSGTVTAGGNRGVKADADVGNFTSTVIINGGAITSTKAAVAVSADTGTAAGTINGGDITGPLSCGQKTGTATLTIPGASTAKFSAQPDAAYVESGYETVLSDGWYVVQAVAPSGLDPAADVTNVVVTAASPEAAIQTVDVTPPTGSGATAGDYKSLFTYEATPAGEGQYTVAITGIQEAVKEDVSEDAVTSLVTAAEDSTATTVTVDVPAGLYYKVTTYDTIGGTPVDTKTGISSGSGTTPVNKPTSATQGFIKVEIGTKAFN